MPPRRPLPDLVLITTFKMFTANDQMMACLMSPRCAVLVRAANRTVKTLLITDTNDANLFRLKDAVNSYSLASYPSMQSLMDIPGEPSFPLYPLATTTPFNHWNVLQLSQLRLALDTAIIEQIATIFSAVTDLMFITFSGTYCEHLVTLLLHPTWQCQLTNLMAKGACERDSQVAQELVTAINGLPALQQLALHWDNPIDLPDLTILAQLKVVVFDSAKLKAFLRSLEQYATDNADLQVHLLTDDTKALFTLSQPLHSRVVSCKAGEHFMPLSTALRLCGEFRFLTSLSIKKVWSTEVGQLFTALSQLQQLVHLGAGIVWDNKKVPAAPRPPRPLSQMNSLQALEVLLFIDSHSDVEWLNLPWTMPNLQTIYTSSFCCASCKVSFFGWRSSTLSLLTSPSALPCFQHSLFTLHSGVPLNRVILGFPGAESISAEKLLLQRE